jgi:hypothetical protein
MWLSVIKSRAINERSGLMVGKNILR